MANSNFFGQLRETRFSETVENIAGERLKVGTVVTVGGAVIYKFASSEETKKFVGDVINGVGNAIGRIFTKK